MPGRFDWVRRSRTGAELLATLEYLERRPALFADQDIGPPHSALRGPCQRCWLYPRQPSPRQTARYCRACQAIVSRAVRWREESHHAVVAWGFVNRLPRQLQGQPGFRDTRILGSFVQDEHHFLLVIARTELKPLVQELAIYHGTDLKGLVQVVPTTGLRGDVNMADIVCRLAHHEANFPMDRLRVRFYAAPYQVLIPHVRDRQGILTFDLAEFVSTLEMAAVFRTVLLPDEQKTIHDLLALNDPAEEQFYWGRLMGYLSQPAKDLLSGWNLRQWSKDRIQLLYELIEYVGWYAPPQHPASHSP